MLPTAGNSRDAGLMGGKEYGAWRMKKRKHSWGSMNYNREVSAVHAQTCPCRACIGSFVHSCVDLPTRRPRTTEVRDVRFGAVSGAVLSRVMADV